jgi:hypothetical protein
VPSLVGAAIAIAAMVAYASTIAPTVTRDDPAELQVLTWAAGIPHGTSYPLYVWLVRALLPFHLGANVAQRVTIVSVLSSGAALFVAYRLAGRLAGDKGPARWVAAAAVTALFAYSYTLWSVSIIADMYALHTFLAALVLHELVRWEQTRDDRRLYAAALVLGASMGNHVITVALLPGAVVFVLLCLWREGRPVRAAAELLVRVGAASLAAVAVFNVFLFYLLWRRHVPFDHWAGILACPSFFQIPPGENSFWYAWWYEIRCRQFRFQLFGVTPQIVSDQLDALPYRVVAEVFPLAAAFAAAGWVIQWWRGWRVNVLFTVTLAAHAFFVISYNQLHKSNVYLIVPTLIVVLYVAIALGAITRLAGVHVLQRRGLGGPEDTAAAVALGALCVLLYWGNERSREACADDFRHLDSAFTRNAVDSKLGPRPDEHGERRVYDEVNRVIERLPRDAIVFGDWPQHYALEYVARVERGRDDLTVYESYPYGSGRHEFPTDYIRLVEDPSRTRSVFFLDAQPPTRARWSGRFVAPGLIEVKVQRSGEP